MAETQQTMAEFTYAPGETNITGDRFSPSVILFWLKTSIAASSMRVQYKSPNTLLGVIPFAYVLATVAKSSTNFAVICIFFCTMSSVASFLMAAMASMVWCLLLLTVLPLARSCSTISSVRGVR